MLASDSVTSAKIVNGTIVNADINASAAIAQSKIANLTSDLASKLPYSYGTATPSTSVDGFLWYDENDTPPTPKFWDGAAFQALTSGKILQIVRATDSTDRSTTSGTFVDVTGMSVTISPSKTSSTVLLVASVNVDILTSANINDAELRITDSSNNSVSGAEEVKLRWSTQNAAPYKMESQLTAVGYATPATTSATTYKLRFRSLGGTVKVGNGTNTGQLYAIEVSA